jgi:hypothetical protein
MIPEVHYVHHSRGYCCDPSRDDDGAARFGEINGAEEVWYWYEEASYEGGGVAILRGSDWRWGVSSLSHCSCDGPWDGDVYWHPTLDDLKSKEGDDDSAPLFAVIGDRR